MTKSHPTPSIPASAESIERRIHLIRGQRVMLDEDLAVVYRTTTGRLNEQVSRNLGRFPADFAFLLTRQEVANLKSQIAISSWGGRRTPPRVFTEHGAVMVASVLNTPVAVAASVYVVRAFVRFRGLALSRRELAGKLADLEGTVSRHDEEIRAVFDAIRELLEAITVTTAGEDRLPFLDYTVTLAASPGLAGGCRLEVAICDLKLVGVMALAGALDAPGDR